MVVGIESISGKALCGRDVEQGKTSASFSENCGRGWSDMVVVWQQPILPGNSKLRDIASCMAVTSIKWRSIIAVICDCASTSVLSQIYRIATFYEFWVLTKLSKIMETKMFHWINGTTRYDRIRNEDIRSQYGFATILEELPETCLHFFLFFFLFYNIWLNIEVDWKLRKGRLDQRWLIHDMEIWGPLTIQGPGIWQKRVEYLIQTRQPQCWYFLAPDKGARFHLSRLSGQRLALSFSVNYLDVILDPKLNWRRNIKVRAKKTCIVFYVCKWTSVRKWGLLWVYI